MRSIEAGLRFLAQNGLRYVFGIPAGSINALYDALIDIPEMEPIIAKHETGAGYMACAYTRVTGAPSVCVGSSGPGATNLVTAAANAWKEKLPVLFITGSVPTKKIGKGAGQELVAEPIFASITKMSTIVFDPQKLPDILAQAYETAISGVPGPVHLAIPIDVQMTDIGEPILPTVTKPVRIKPEPEAMEQLLQIVTETGSQGALLLGHGAKSASSLIVRLAETTGWKVATTPRGKGAFPENHPLSLGVYGMSGNAEAIEFLNDTKHDLLMVIGSSLGESETANWEPKLVAGKRLVHVDIDKKEFGKNFEPDLAVHGDAEIVIEQLLREIENETGSKENQSMMYGLPENLRYEKPFDEDHAGWNTELAIRQLSACAPGDTRFYVDIGEMMTYSIQYLKIVDDQQFDLDISLGGMGSGISGVIGAKLADPARPTVCISGDGCFFMHGMEIMTAKEYKLPIVFVIINNARLGMVYHGHNLQYKRCPDRFSQERVSIADAMEALGVRTVKVHSLADLQPQHLEEWLAAEGPVVVEVIVEGNEIPPMGERVKFLQGATY
ncbi:thiamine pyrophosphate-binding protein [Effusibacillus dendaii]|uniref:Acetolactate synthase n=1 Tax=Effusibacillus dendaii TaxID=2743772 RepID=A0A7I8DC34_9BACL|nr:thiamine pyrophosphate-binding protein [Effusibacillus dendaii]BCJ86892.1 acetolactate synthase [Effusibacillus dendaii]